LATRSMRKRTELMFQVVTVICMRGQRVRTAKLYERPEWMGQAFANKAKGAFGENHR
jgi:hypothetical protein